MRRGWAGDPGDPGPEGLSAPDESAPVFLRRIARPPPFAFYRWRRKRTFSPSPGRGLAADWLRTLPPTPMAAEFCGRRLGGARPGARGATAPRTATGQPRRTATLGGPCVWGATRRACLRAPTTRRRSDSGSKRGGPGPHGPPPSPGPIAGRPLPGGGSRREGVRGGGGGRRCLPPAGACGRLVRTGRHGRRGALWRQRRAGGEQGRGRRGGWGGGNHWRCASAELAGDRCASAELAGDRCASAERAGDRRASAELAGDSRCASRIYNAQPWLGAGQATV